MTSSSVATAIKTATGPRIVKIRHISRPSVVQVRSRAAITHQHTNPDKNQAATMMRAVTAQLVLKIVVSQLIQELLAGPMVLFLLGAVALPSYLSNHQKDEWPTKGKQLERQTLIVV